MDRRAAPIMPPLAGWLICLLVVVSPVILRAGPCYTDVFAAITWRVGSRPGVFVRQFASPSTAAGWTGVSLVSRSSGYTVQYCTTAPYCTLPSSTVPRAATQPEGHLVPESPCGLQLPLRRVVSGGDTESSLPFCTGIRTGQDRTGQSGTVLCSRLSATRHH